VAWRSFRGAPIDLGIALDEENVLHALCAARASRLHRA
jgi:hypothetical protein